MAKILAFIISLSFFLVLTTAWTTTLYSETALQALVERQAKAWETQDVVSLIGDFAPDAVFKAGGFTFKGMNAIQKVAEDYFRQFRDTKVEIKKMIIKDRQGAVEWNWSDRHKETGKPSAAEDAIIFEVGDKGKIIYWREYIEKKKVKN